MRKSLTSILAAVIVMAFAVPAIAGGFYVLLGNPDASAEARAHNAFVTIKVAGCHNPEKAGVTATAISLVNGRRESVPLKVIALAEPGMYAVAKQWPSEGRWVLQFVATDSDRVANTMVVAGPSGIERQNAKYGLGQPTASDLTALLAGVSGGSLAKK